MGMERLLMELRPTLPAQQSPTSILVLLRSHCVCLLRYTLSSSSSSLG